MNRSYLRVLAVSALVLCSSQAMASKVDNDNNAPRAVSASVVIDEDGFELIDTTPNAPAVVDLTYKQECKILGDKLVAGFKATSPAGWLTRFIAGCTKLYAGIVFGADSITEGYLLKGEEKSLNIRDLQAVYNHLSETFASRITGNVEKGASVVPVKYVDYLGKALNFGGNKYYNYRLAKALNWVYAEDAKLFAPTETLPVDLLEKEMENTGAGVEALMQQITSLEEGFDKGLISKEEYDQQAEGLKADVVVAVNKVLEKSEPVEDLVAKTNKLLEDSRTFLQPLKVQNSNLAGQGEN